MLTSFFKDGAIYGLIKIITSGSAFLLLPIYTKSLSLEEYGAVDFLMVSANIAYIIVSLEISQGFVRFFSDSESELEKIQYASTALWFMFTIARKDFQK